MPRTGYDNCIRVMKHLLNRGIEKQVAEGILEHAIKKEVGMDDRTVDKYKTQLDDLGFIRPVNSSVYELEKSPYVYEGYGEELESVREEFREAIGAPVPGLEENKSRGEGVEA